jgi:hypothetical protein
VGRRFHSPNAESCLFSSFHLVLDGRALALNLGLDLSLGTSVLASRLHSRLLSLNDGLLAGRLLALGNRLLTGLHSTALFRHSSLLSRLLPPNDGRNVSKDKRDARPNLHPAAFDDGLVLDRHNGVPVGCVGLWSQDEQVSRTQDKLVSRDGPHLVVRVGFPEMKFARLSQAERNDRRVGRNVSRLVRVEANVVVCSSVASEDDVIQLHILSVDDQVAIERFNHGVNFRDGADVAVRPHAAMLKARIAVARHGGRRLVEQRLRIRRNHEKSFFSSKLATAILEIRVRRVSPRCTGLQTVEQRCGVESEDVLDETRDDVAVQQSVLDVGDGLAFERH